MKEDGGVVPEYLKEAVGTAPVIALDDVDGIVRFLRGYLEMKVPCVQGLVLAGGNSVRMGRDKGLLTYHGKEQREYVYELLASICDKVYVSCNAEQSGGIGLPKIEDQFLGLGPLGGILSAFQHSPDNAWLTVACDLPFVSAVTLRYLLEHRNPAKMATAFMDSEGKFPEPLITIWEPRAYPILMLALAEGYSCPRKVLINSDVELVQAPDVLELENVNDNMAYERATARISEQALSERKNK
jgi:molybdopterin-guanine dinucleotide biosynthesis protein A